MTPAPFPAVHRAANEGAAQKVEAARASSSRAQQLLDEIDQLLTTPNERS